MIDEKRKKKKKDVIHVLTLMLLLPAPLVWFEDWSQNPKTKGLLPFLLYVAAPGLATQSDAMQSDASILMLDLQLLRRNPTGWCHQNN